MALNLVDNESFEFVPQTDGTVTAAFTESSSSFLNAKQIGDIVFLAGALAIDGTFADLTNSVIGTLTDVSAPNRLYYIPVKTYDSGLTAHDGLLLVYNDAGTVKLTGSQLVTTDVMMMINGHYFA